jgi:hypothetical protein
MRLAYVPRSVGPPWPTYNADDAALDTTSATGGPTPHLRRAAAGASRGCYSNAKLLAMGKPRTAQPVKLIVGLLSWDVDLLRRARHLLVRAYGPADLESEIWPFDQTDYYAAEMGPDLCRWFLSFDRLIRPDELAEIKRNTNELERQIADDCLLADRQRPVNLDPGYISLAKLVLATTKDRSHRLYLGAGIYGEVTLHYSEGAWQVWPWTYPDYRKPEYHAFFERVRERYRAQRTQIAVLPEPSGESSV